MPMFLKQYLVAGSSLLGALSVGCSLGYPGILLKQLASNDSSIEVDSDTSSWIGAIHGIAGLPSLIVPAFMQWKGRRLGFIISCLISIVGWILSYTATSSTRFLISESFNGFGSQCISAATAFSMSEMLSPKVRKLTMGHYLVIMTLGMAVIQIAGSYLHWRTVSIIVCAPLIISIIASCLWPESPSWLACKGEFSQCAKSFTQLRGTDEDAQAELEELILAQKENLSRDKTKQHHSLKRFWKTLTSRDFYLPNLHIYVLLQTSYWSGCIVHIIYAADIIERATHSKDAVFYGSMAFNISLFVFSFLGTFLIQYFKPKKILIASALGMAVGLVGGSAVSYFQTAGLMVKESNVCLYLLVGYMICYSLIVPIIIPMTGELIPVKHRGMSGPVQVIFPCILHTTALKAGPHMLKYLDLWGMLLVFATNASLCTLFIWRYVPETKGRTLQQLEDYYNYGNFDKCRRVDADKCLTELMPFKD